MSEKRPPEALPVVARMHREDMVLGRLRKVLLKRNEANYDAIKPGNERREPREAANILVVGRRNAEPFGERF